jgi:hypothetical protein
MYRLAESLGVGRDEYRLVALGSTPKRLQALLAGECDATMLNAGNELRAEEQGCPRLASVAEVCSPYLGTVVAVAGTERLAQAQALGAVLTATVEDICAGDAARVAAEEAAALLHLSPALADRYVARLRDPAEGLVRGGGVDRAALDTLVGLRRAYLPEVVDGTDVLASATEPGSGLVEPAAAA